MRGQCFALEVDSLTDDLIDVDQPPVTFGGGWWGEGDKGIFLLNLCALNRAGRGGEGGSGFLKNPEEAAALEVEIDAGHLNFHNLIVPEAMRRPELGGTILDGFLIA